MRTCPVSRLAGWRRLPALRAALIAVLLASPWASAETLRWSGPEQGSWQNPDNWDLGRIPAFGDDVIVDGGAEVTFEFGESTPDSLTMQGRLNVASGTLILRRASSITGELLLAPGVTLQVEGADATLSVSGAATIDGANLRALNGALLELPGVRQFTGTGSLVADNGGRIRLLGLMRMGIPADQPTPDPELNEAISREFTVFHASAGVGGADTEAIVEAVSREFTVFHRPSGVAGADAEAINEAISREFTVFHSPIIAPGLLGISNVVSREVSVFRAQPGIEVEPAESITNVVSREVSVFRFGANAPGNPVEAITNAVSREVSIFRSQPGADSSQEVSITTAIGREVSVFRQLPGATARPQAAIINVVSRELSVFRTQVDLDADPVSAISNAVSREVSVERQPEDGNE